MKTSPRQKISVVLPAYNHEQYIGAAIESVLGQTLADFELIIIDDCSTDATADIVMGYKDDRIRFLKHEENQGSCKTINEGLKLARGEYVTILNSDDIYATNRFEKILACIETHGALFVASDLDLINSNGEVVRDKTHWWLQWFEMLKGIYSSSHDIVQALLRGNFLITTSNFFLKRDVLDKIGYLNDYRYTLDYEFILRFLSSYPDGLFYLEERLLQYRLHETNTIREDPLEPNRETFNILLAWFPSLLKGSDQSRAEALRLQLEKVLGHIEAETSLLWQDKLQEVELRTSQTEQELRRELEELYRKVNHSQEEMTRLKSSHSYRLGYTLLQPLRILKGK